MRKALFAATAILTLCATSALANIDCRRDLRPVERLICSSSNLLDLDASMSAYYFRLRNDATRRAARDLLDNQRNWLEWRDTCKTVSCLREMYTFRIQELKAVLD